MITMLTYPYTGHEDSVLTTHGFSDVALLSSDTWFMQTNANLLVNVDLQSYSGNSHKWPLLMSGLGSH